MGTLVVKPMPASRKIEKTDKLSPYCPFQSPQVRVVLDTAPRPANLLDPKPAGIILLD
jgi:hypothetical protein